MTDSVDWLDQLFAAVDALDTTRFIGFLSSDAEFRFGSAPTVSRSEDIAAAVDDFFATIAGCRHVVANTWNADGTIAYLESSNPRNVPFYQRHGFETTHVVQVGSSPTFTLMTRQPR